MHVLTGLRAGARRGSARSGAPWTPPTARGMPKAAAKGERPVGVHPSRGPPLLSSSGGTHGLHTCRSRPHRAQLPHLRPSLRRRWLVWSMYSPLAPRVAKAHRWAHPADDSGYTQVIR